MLVLHELDRLVAWTGEHSTLPGPGASPGAGAGTTAGASPSPVPGASPGPCALPADAVAAVHEAHRALARDVKAYKLAVLAAWAISPTLALALGDR